MQAAMDGRTFRNFMETSFDTRTIPGARGSTLPGRWGCSSGRSALVLLWDDPGSTSFVLTAIGLGIVFVGVIIVSNVWKTPHYKVMLAWDPEALPADWEAGRRTYFTINWIQLATTWSAFALFLVALASL
jgi:hypothetical protein